ncbi:High-affinity branched-chain amino acid ABC transporter (LivM) [Mycobacteroides abscessus subsp. massiliense]|nr:High-affinity branched-chain amino acid ABC transporter (LivM) [Mycobacteroides abscessus subsp. massiliense]
MGTSAFFSSSWAWLSCLPIAVAIAAFFGLVLGTPTLRLRGDYLAIVTLGFGEIIGSSTSVVASSPAAIPVVT